MQVCGGVVVHHVGSVGGCECRPFVFCQPVEQVFFAYAHGNTGDFDLLIPVAYIARHDDGAAIGIGCGGDFPPNAIQYGVDLKCFVQRFADVGDGFQLSHTVLQVDLCRFEEPHTVNRRA